MSSTSHSADMETALFRLRSPLDLRIAVADMPRMPSLQHCTVVDRSMLATVVSELGSNILKYAGAGQTRHQHPRHQHPRTAVELVAEDQGPGIADIALALQEHYSTAGTLGLGLPGVRRMVEDFHIDSQPGQGCRVQVRKWLLPSVQTIAHAASAPQAPLVTHRRTHQVCLPASSGPHGRPALVLEIAEINRPCWPHYLSGDCTLVQPVEGGLLLACIDASGHGQRAHALALQLQDQIRTCASPQLAPLLHQLHLRAVGTVGAAVALAYVDLARHTLRFAGVGNIRMRCLGATPWTGISRDGVLGERFPTPDIQQFSLQADDVVLLHSDGIHDSTYAKTRTALRARLRLGSAQHIAETLLELGGTPGDDASCIAIKCKA